MLLFADFFFQNYFISKYSFRNTLSECQKLESRSGPTFCRTRADCMDTQSRLSLDCSRRKVPKYQLVVLLTHIRVASFLWDIDNQCRPRSDAAERGV